MTNERDTWLGVVRPLLGSIKSNASWVRHHAKEIQDRVRMLPYRPDFETEAISQIEYAIKEAQDAVDILREAKHVYDSKPEKS